MVQLSLRVAAAPDQEMRDRSITLADLNQLRLWIESDPEVTDDEWYKDFGSFKYAEKGDIRKLSCCQFSQLEEQSYSGAERILLFVTILILDRSS